MYCNCCSTCCCNTTCNNNEVVYSNNCYYPQYSYPQYSVPCPTPTPICPVPTPVCPIVTYITNIASSTAILSGGTSIPAGTVIPTGSTAVPAGTVTVVNGYTGAPIKNEGGIIPNNGFFTVPVAGRYIISSNQCFNSVATVASTDVREVYIYKVEASTGLVTMIADDSRTPIAGSATCVNVSSVVDLAANDRIFIAVRQTNVAATTIDTVAASGRLAIARIC